MNLEHGVTPYSRTHLGYFLLALAAVFWGLNGSIARHFFSLGLTVPELAFLRCATGAFCFGLHAVARKEWRVASHNIPKLLLFGMVCLGLFTLSYQASVHESGAALAVILLYTAPAWVALLSRAFLKHRINRRTLAAIGIAMTGVFLITLAGSANDRLSWLGVTAGLASAFLYALHFPWNFRWRGIYSPITLYAYAMLGGAILLLPFTAFVVLPALVWLQVLPGLALITYLPYLCYGQGMRSVHPAPAAVIVNLEPIVGCLTAYLWWNEQFTLPGWLGAGLVIGAVFLTILGKKTPNTL